MNLSERPANIEWYVEQMVKFLSELGVPSWTAVVFVERLDLIPNTKKVIEQGHFWSIEKYKERFEALVTRGYSWVNLHAVGIIDNQLILEIDWPPYEPGHAPVASVNLSGPEKWVQDRNWSLDGIVEIRRTN